MAHQNSAPVVLLLASLRWPIAARLAIAFAYMGCRVEALCPRQHPVARTRGIGRIYPYNALTPLASLRAAILESAPDMIIPCDDDAALHLSQLYARAGTHASETALRSVISRSLGKPEACAIASERGRLIALAHEEGVRVPETKVVKTPGELKAWLMERGFPAVIKRDYTWGGQGVSIVRSHEEAQAVFKLMSSRPSMPNTLVRMLLDRDPSFLLRWLTRTRYIITVQDFIMGTPANRAVACWQGKVLAGISAEALSTQHPTGPATAVRVIEHAEMSDAVNRLVRRLGVSGLWGIDFILEASSGSAYLIEVNPRATPICHLPLGVNRNLPAAIYERLMGASPRTQRSIDHDVIALFPEEWRRNPGSAYLASGYHDMPLGEPELIQECIDKPWAERGVLARLWTGLRPVLSTQRVSQKRPRCSPQRELNARSSGP